MRRFKQFTLAAAGILILALAIAIAGVGQTVAATVSKGVQKVFVTNPVEVQKVLVTNPVSPPTAVSPPATTPVQFAANIAVPSGVTGDQTVTAYTVPAGKRLVLTFVSAHLHQQTSDEFTRAGFSIGSGPIFFIPLQHELGRGTGYDFDWVGSETVQVYVEAGNTVVAHAPHSLLTDAGTPVDFAFAGYLSDSK